MLTQKIAQNTDFQYYTSIMHIDEELWRSAAPSNNIFLQYDYLSLLERVSPGGLSFAYVIVFGESQPVGVAYFQIKDFDVAASLRGYVVQGKLPHWTEYITKRLKFNCLVSGNLLVTGEHGYYFNDAFPEYLHTKKHIEIIQFVSERLEKEGRRTALNFVKDFHAEQSSYEAIGGKSHDFYPNMVLDIMSHWKRFDDYLADMTTKYRTRAKRAFKKQEGLACLPMDELLLTRHRDDMHRLYLKIAHSVGFNLFELHPDYFLELKRTFGDDSEIWGYFDNNKLVGFYTTLKNYEELETGFLGFEEAYNASHQIYLNFLYDMVRQGIEKGVKRIVFARTAMEIKSSIGAIPLTMHTYISHRNEHFNAYLPNIVDRLTPKMEWTQRRPFKSADATSEEEM